MDFRLPTSFLVIEMMSGVACPSKISCVLRSYEVRGPLCTAPMPFLAILTSSQKTQTTSMAQSLAAASARSTAKLFGCYMEENTVALIPPFPLNTAPPTDSVKPFPPMQRQAWTRYLAPPHLLRPGL